MSHYYYNNQQPLVVDARTIAYALLGACKAMENAGNEGERRAHQRSMRALQDLLRTFEDKTDV